MNNPNKHVCLCHEGLARAHAVTLGLPTQPATLLQSYQSWVSSSRDLPWKKPARAENKGAARTRSLRVLGRLAVTWPDCRVSTAAFTLVYVDLARFGLGKPRNFAHVQPSLWSLAMASAEGGLLLANRKRKAKKVGPSTLNPSSNVNAPEERRMVLLGVDNAGKTTTLEKLKSLFGLKGMAPDRPHVTAWIKQGPCLGLIRA